MKRLAIVLFVIFFYEVSAQTLTTYTYDTRGNRISKQVRGSSPHPTVTASPEAVNPSQPAVLTASGCAGGSIQWSPVNLSGSQITVSPNATTQYTAQCVVSGCANSGVGNVKVTLIQCPSLSISAFSNVQTIRNGSQVILYANGCNILRMVKVWAKSLGPQVLLVVQLLQISTEPQLFIPPLVVLNTAPT